MNYRKIILVLISLILISISAASGSTVQVENRTVKIGETFDIIVTVTPTESLAGLQANIVFNPAILRINSISEGNLLKQSGQNTFFNAGTIQNQNGIINNTFDVIIGPYNVTGQGTYIIINTTAIKKGTSGIYLDNVKLSSPQGTLIVTTLIDGSVVVVPKYDLNMDGIMDILDLQLISSHFGEMNSEYDQNGDVFIDIIDLVIVAQHVGEQI